MSVVLCLLVMPLLDQASSRVDGGLQWPHLATAWGDFLATLGGGSRP